MSRKTRKLIWPLPGMATFAIVAVLAILVVVPVGITLAQTVSKGDPPTGLKAERDDTNMHTQIELSWTNPEETGWWDHQHQHGNTYRIDVSRDGMTWELLDVDARDDSDNNPSNGCCHGHARCSSMASSGCAEGRRYVLLSGVRELRHQRMEPAVRAGHGVHRDGDPPSGAGFA